ncbi:uncharacterized protein [Aegilops tauschii subsp. strangulata]|uniref:uncharacterized protein n=1 Tax=Aegilops tauschii subsp. strangulata TaxID=200361 RepID=UPI003CC85E56
MAFHCDASQNSKGVSYSPTFTGEIAGTTPHHAPSPICYASVAHPRSNGQAERANTEVLKGLKTRSLKKNLEACDKGYLDELQSVLWSIRTTATRPTDETPFFLVYRAEAVLPLELKHGSPRVLAFDKARQDGSQESDLLLLEEARRQAAFRAARYQQALRRYHSRNIRPRTIEVGDLVLRGILSREGLHKLSPMGQPKAPTSVGGVASSYLAGCT